MVRQHVEWHSEQPTIAGQAHTRTQAREVISRLAASDVNQEANSQGYAVVQQPESAVNQEANSQDYAVV